MSGRKDYSYTLTAIRRAAEEAASAERARKREEKRRQREDNLKRKREEAAKRKAGKVQQRLADARRKTEEKLKLEAARRAESEVKQRLNEAQQRSSERLSELSKERTREIVDQQTTQQQENAARLAEAAEKNRAAINAANKRASEEVLQLAHALGVSKAKVNKLTGDDVSPDSTTHLIDICDEQQQLNKALEKNALNLQSWMEALRDSDEVKHFAAHRLHPWEQATAQLLDASSDAQNTPERLASIQQAILQAEQIDAEAIEVAEKFEQRNSVLKDILESLQEVGFFVQDPEYVDPARPDQAVIIRANRADQTMEAKVDLNAAVESDWQGVHGEYCTSAFFDYVKQMKLRGVEISSEDPRLSPQLKHHDALNLPNQNERRSESN